MEKIWLRSYPPGVPEELELDPQRSLASLVEDACNRFSSQPAFTSYGRTISYAELDELSARFAASLQKRLGLQKGDRVALMMPNCLQYAVALVGVLRAGLVVVNVNPLYTARELHHQLDDSGARAILVIANAGATLAEIVDQTPVEHVIVTGLGDLLGFPKRQVINFAVRYIRRLVPSFRLPGAISFDEMLAADPGQLDAPTVQGTDLAFLQYTGGTTGLSKGAMLSHSNMVANVQQINIWFSSICIPGQEIVITALPLYHVYALTCNCFAYLDLGGHNVLITDPRDTPSFVKELGKWRFNTITGVNTLYQSLLDYPEFAKLDFSSVKIASAGGMAVMDFTARAWSQLTGTAIIEGYGLSETSPVVTSNRPDLKEYTGVIGLPLPSTDISLRDDDGREVALGEAGELCVSGPQVMSGYWGNEAATKNVMTEDGFLKTGDVAVVDDKGYFRIVDRKKDMILVSGFNVYPNEIENILTLHEDVAEAAVVGVPDEDSGEIVKAFVVTQPDADIDVHGLREFCREHLARYKIPKQVEFRDELPKSNVGKILRRLLREEAED